MERTLWAPGALGSRHEPAAARPCKGAFACPFHLHLFLVCFALSPLGFSLSWACCQALCSLPAVQFSTAGHAMAQPGTPAPSVVTLVPSSQNCTVAVFSRGLHTDPHPSSHPGWHSSLILIRRMFTKEKWGRIHVWFLSDTASMPTHQERRGWRVAWDSYSHFPLTWNSIFFCLWMSWVLQFTSLGGAPWSATLPLCFTCFKLPAWKA